MESCAKRGALRAGRVAVKALSRRLAETTADADQVFCGRRRGVAVRRGIASRLRLLDVSPRLDRRRRRSLMHRAFARDR
jgi:hypothetical protein